MGKSDALETQKILLTLSNAMVKEIDETEMKDAFSRQDKIRRLIVVGLEHVKNNDLVVGEQKPKEV